MDTTVLQKLITEIEESNTALWRMLIEIDRAKTMLPHLSPSIVNTKIKLKRSIYALAEIKKELGLTGQP